MAVTNIAQLTPWFDRLATLPDMENVHNLFTNTTLEGRQRLANLRRYFEISLRQSPSTLLVGEAPGYQGTYRTGVPFTSEDILMGPQNKFGLHGGEANGFGLAMPSEKLWKEPSATIVQRTVNQLSELPLIWATFPLHPHLAGKELSNRAPKTDEVVVGASLLQELVTILRPRQIVAVGNVAEKTLSSLGMPAVKVRHPSHGGAMLFHQQVMNLLAKGAAQD